MIIHNGVKYACISCIRGHRSTTCDHKDRPLIQVRPRGRPPPRDVPRVALIPKVETPEGCTCPPGTCAHGECCCGLEAGLRSHSPAVITDAAILASLKGPRDGVAPRYTLVARKGRGRRSVAVAGREASAPPDIRPSGGCCSGAGPGPASVEAPQDAALKTEPDVVQAPAPQPSHSNTPQESPAGALSEANSSHASPYDHRESPAMGPPSVGDGYTPSPADAVAEDEPVFTDTCVFFPVGNGLYKRESLPLPGHRRLPQPKMPHLRVTSQSHVQNFDESDAGVTGSHHVQVHRVDREGASANYNAGPPPSKSNNDQQSLFDDFYSARSTQQEPTMIAPMTFEGQSALQLGLSDDEVLRLWPESSGRDIEFAAACVIPDMCQCGDDCSCDGCYTHGQRERSAL